MGNPFAGSSAAGTGSNPFTNSRSSGSANPFTGTPSGTSAPAPHHRGFLGNVAHLAGQTASDLEHAAINTPAGLMQLHNALAKADPSNPRHFGHSNVKPLEQLGKAYGQQVKETVKHPLRHPGDTALIAAPLVGTAARIGLAGAAAGSALKAGDVAGAAKAIVKKPNLGPRTLREPGSKLVVHPEQSRSSFGQLSTQTFDKMLQNRANKKPGLAREALRHKVGKINTATVKQAERNAQGPAARLIGIGRKLAPSEQKALELHAEEAPVAGRITATSARLIGTSDKLRRQGHQKELELLHDAQKHLTTDAQGRPRLKPTETKLLNTYKLMQQVSGNREDVLRALRMLTDEAIQGRKTNAARVALGAKHQQFFAEVDNPRVGLAVRVKGNKTLGRISRVDKRSGEVTVFYPRFSRSVAVKAGQLETAGRTIRETTERAVKPEEAQARLDKLELAHDTAVAKIAEAKFGTASMSEVRFRNRENAKARRQAAGLARGGKLSGASGFKATLRPTIKDEQRRAVEREVEAAYQRNPENPVLKRWVARAEEIDKLRQGLTPAAPGEKPGSLGTVTETTYRRTQQKAGITGHEDFKASGEAVRIPDVATRRGSKNVARQAAFGAQGTIRHPRAPGSVTHEYTGILRHLGLRRQDTTQLVGESGLEAAKFGALLHLHTIARKAAHAVPDRKDDIAVRLENLKPNAKMPVDVKRFLSDPDEYLHQASPLEQARTLDRVREFLFMPSKNGQVNGLSPEAHAEFDRLNNEGKIGWVPKRVLGELGKPTAPLRAVTGGPVTSAVDAINNASRMAILYLKPAYAVPNILGNAALSIIQQGFAAPKNLAQAARLIQRLHPDDYAQIDSAMGEGLARAVSAHGAGRMARTVDWTASQWSKGVDTPFRRSSFLYEAKKAGHRTPAQLHELVHRDPHDPELVRIGLRANRDIIDYENLGNTEREIVRRVVFFYPWVKGSTVYASRFVKEHPGYTGAVGVLGPAGQKYSQDAFAPGLPSYLEGFIPYGSNRAMNPASAAILQTPAQVGMAIGGLASGNIPEVAQAANFFTPAASLVEALRTRTDPGTGIPYRPGTPGWDVAYDQLVKGLPQYSLGRAIKAALTGHGGSRTYPPNVQDALARFFLGGMWPSRVNRPAIAQQYLSEQQRLRTGR